MFSFLCESSSEVIRPDWVVNSFPIIKFILVCLIALCSLALIVLVLMQESEGGDTTNSITGIKDTYYSKNKGLSKDARLKKWTTILSIAIAVMVLCFVILAKIFSGNIWG